MMIGTLLNAASIIIASLLGNLLSNRLPERLRQTVVMGLGLFTLLLGVQMFLKSDNTLIVLASIFLGGIMGEWLQIENVLQKLGEWLEQKLAARDVSDPDSGKFSKGFLTASLVFCIGPMAILGALQDGLTGKFDLLIVKSTLDALGSIAFASALGLGVAFSALPVAIYQGALTLLAKQLQPLMSNAMINEMTACGGVLLVGIAISSFLELRKLRMGNILPALVIAPAIVALFTWLGYIK
jgi:uncharacterized membrane protein YqgA involved in biofilm formation